MKILRSFGFAWQGLRYSFATQLNFKIHLLLALFATGLGIGLQISTADWMLVLFCMAIVLFAEMVNTAIEKLCDLVEPRIHPQIKLVKDITAGAVIISAVVSAVTGAIIFLPKIILLF